MRFVVILPTIRDGMGALTLAHLFDSLTVPTDVQVLRGFHGNDEGDGHKINYAVTHWIDPTRHDYAVKMDDDVILRRGWQDALVQAFEKVPGVGLVGLDMSSTPVGEQYMVRGMPSWAMVPAFEEGGVMFRTLNHGNVGGAVYCSPAWLMFKIGAMPLRADIQHPHYSDGWYNVQVRKHGLRCGYVVPPEPLAVMIEPPDTPEYIAGKQADEQRALPHLPGWMR